MHVGNEEHDTGEYIDANMLEMHRVVRKLQIFAQQCTSNTKAECDVAELASQVDLITQELELMHSRMQEITSIVNQYLTRGKRI